MLAVSKIQVQAWDLLRLSPGDEWSETEYNGLHPVDVHRAVSDAPCAAALLSTLPWAVRYLWFLSPSAAASPYFRHAHSALQPQLSPHASVTLRMRGADKLICQDISLWMHCADVLSSRSHMQMLSPSARHSRPACRVPAVDPSPLMNTKADGHLDAEIK